jgi:ABC-type nitrate/sulfonate/bicarbonate transport system ATPase subunit
MGTRPGRVVETLAIDLPRPRLRSCTTKPEFMAIKERCLDLLREFQAAPVEQAA